MCFVHSWIRLCIYGFLVCEYVQDKDRRLQTWLRQIHIYSRETTFLLFSLVCILFHCVFFVSSLVHRHSSQFAFVCVFGSVRFGVIVVSHLLANLSSNVTWYDWESVSISNIQKANKNLFSFFLSLRLSVRGIFLPCSGSHSHNW